MKTIKIRDVRGSTLEEFARAGDLVGLSRDRALIAVVVPMMQAWVEHMIDHNWSRMLQSVTRSEMALDSGQPVTLEAALSAAERESNRGAEDRDPTPHQASSPSPSGRIHLGEVGKAAASRALTGPALEMIKRLTAVLGQSESPEEPSIRSSTTIRVGELSARRIEQAALDSELLVLTNDRALIGIVVPVSQHLVEFLVSQNLSRVLFNIQRAEEEAASLQPFHTLSTLQETDEEVTTPRLPHQADSPLPRETAT